MISVHGLKSRVLGDDGQVYECAVRQVLKSLDIDQRSVVVAGDRVRLRAASPVDGMIESVEPRRGLISRTSRGQQHVIAANVDYLLIIASAAQPTLKPALIDRFLLTAQQCEVDPVIVINKVDLIDITSLQPIIGVYASLGYRVLLTSAQTNVTSGLSEGPVARQANGLGWAKRCGQEQLAERSPKRFGVSGIGGQQRQRKRTTHHDRGEVDSTGGWRSGVRYTRNSPVSTVGHFR